MRYEIWTPVYEEKGQRRHKYRIMFDKFVIESVRTYATKQIAKRKALEHMTELRAAFNNQLFMLVKLVG